MGVTLDSLHGRVLDVCSFEQTPFAWHGKVYGERGQRFRDANMDLVRPFEGVYGEPDGTDTELTPQLIWETKGVNAPSAADLNRRPEVLDVMGIQRQMVFPAILLLALPQAFGKATFCPSPTSEQILTSRELLDAYNEWAAELTNRYADRLRVSGALVTHEVSPEEMVQKAEHLIELGVKAILIPTKVPPAGLSPADPALDPFYALLAGHNVPLILRGTPLTTGFRASAVWGATPASVWEGGRSVGRLADFVTDVHQAEEHFLTSMVYGGVFERNPTLRLGVFKVGASWIGPLAERMDRGLPPFVYNDHLPMKPSEYLARNVRVSPFADSEDDFEPVEVWLERYPHIQDVYCYSSDYPLVEGGQWSMKKYYDRLAPLGDEIVNKFFCTNARLILP